MSLTDWIARVTRRPRPRTDNVLAFRDRLAYAAGNVHEALPAHHTLAREAYGAVSYLFDDRGHFQSFMQAARVLGNASVEFGLFSGDAPTFGGSPLSIEDSAFYIALAVYVGNLRAHNAAASLLRAHVALREKRETLDRELNKGVLTASAKRAQALANEYAEMAASVESQSLAFLNVTHHLLRPQVYASWHSFAGADARSKFPPVHVFVKRHGKE